MSESGKIIQMKMKYIDDILTKIENNENVSVIEILKNEMAELKQLALEMKEKSEEKKVVGKEEKGNKVRYYLKDGSSYVVKGKEYKYLYDSKSKTVTYEFENGQIERTFENGIKEIRRKDGTIIVKSSQKEYDFLE